MKPVKIIFSLMLLVSTLSLMAQRPGGRPMGTPEEMATQMTARHDSLLTLDESQYEAVYALNLDQVNKMRQLREENAGDRTAMREGMTAARQEWDEAMQIILTAEQYKTWQAHLTDRRGTRQGPGQRPGQGRRPARN